jgi:hypothetical protein
MLAACLSMACLNTEKIMGALGMILMVLGVTIGLVGYIWIVVIAFDESILWGLGSLFIGLVALIFVLMHWDRAAKPFLINLAGCALLFLGSFMSASASGTL